MPSSDQLETMLNRLQRDQAGARTEVSPAERRKDEVRNARILSLKAALAKSKPKSKFEPGERGSQASRIMDKPLLPSAD